MDKVFGCYSPSVVISSVPPWIVLDTQVNLQLLEKKRNRSDADNNHYIVTDFVERWFYRSRLYTQLDPRTLIMGM